MKTLLHDTFSSLAVRNYRLYFIGQAISVTGTFMQGVAQSWLVLQLSHSGTALGIVAALQFVPILVFGPWGGVIADRYDKRRILFLTQTLFALMALLLGALVLTHSVRVWMIGGIAFFYGLVNLVDNPVRQTLVPDMVGTARLRNAVTLYSGLVNLARVIGPLLAAFLIATIDIGMCFIYNGLSYGAIIFLLFIMEKGELYRSPRAKRKRGEILAGLRYIRNTPILRNTLIMMAIIGTLTYEFQVSLPLLAQFTFHGNAKTYAWLISSQGLGSIVGGLMVARQKQSSVRTLLLAALLFGITTLIAAFMPSLSLTLIFIFATGLFSILFQTVGNTILQLESDPRMRGRVMSYWTMAFLGSTAVGGPLIGWIGQVANPRFGLGLGGGAAILAAVIGHLSITRMEKRPTERVSNIAGLATDTDRK